CMIESRSVPNPFQANSSDSFTTNPAVQY
ncbi:uncharacterized protein METZ01_LOCUS320304, partial [marine metagenome]